MPEHEICEASCENTALSEKEKKPKRKIVKKAGKATIKFIAMRILAYAFTSVFSALLVLFAQKSFDDTFNDYYYKTYVPIENEIKAVMQDISATTDMPVGEIPALFDKNDTLEKAKTLFKTSAAYISEDDDINKLHGVCVSICEDLYDLTLKIYITASLPQETQSSSLINASLLTDAIQLTDTLSVSEQFIDSSILNEATSMVTKMEMFEELRDEICKKNEIATEALVEK